MSLSVFVSALRFAFSACDSWSAGDGIHAPSVRLTLVLALVVSLCLCLGAQLVLAAVTLVLTLVLALKKLSSRACDRAALETAYRLTH